MAGVGAVLLAALFFVPSWRGIVLSAPSDTDEQVGLEEEASLVRGDSSNECESGNGRLLGA